MKKQLYMIAAGFFMLSLFTVCSAQQQRKITTADLGTLRNAQVLTIAYYNLENLFDTIPNQPEGGDLDFTPTGAFAWNTHKYNEKLRRLSYAISRIGLDVSPVGAVVLGVSEVENRAVLEDLVRQPAIADRQYGIVHFDSPDRRGIDNALLYNPRFFTVTNSVAHPFPRFRSRDQLLVSGYLMGEKMHFIINHWPSRLGGEERSRPNRVAAAEVTMAIIDSIQRIEPNAKIIVMGDFNDDPRDYSIAVTLNAKRNREDVQPGGLYNPFWAIHDRGIGTLSFRGRWNLFDQLILSYSLVNAPRNEWRFWRAEVFNRDFLTHQTGRDRGIPLRTHQGGVWLNGFSDHFPSLIYVVREVE